MVEVGKSYSYTVHRTTLIPREEKDKPPKARARCVWVHPAGRFAVLQYADGVKECFKLADGRILDDDD